MSGLFDDILSSPASSSGGMFDDILKAPSFSDVKGGASSSPSFAGVSGGSATADEPSEWQAAVDKTLKGVSELPNALYQGLQSGSNKLGEWATLAGAAPIGLFDDIVGTNLQDKYFENVVQPFTKGAEYNQEQINQMQLPGQIVAGVGQAAPEVGLGLMSGGETMVPRAAAATSEILGTVAGNVVKMSAPLAEKSAGQAYGQAIADGKDPTQATGDALAAIGETIAMAAGGGQVEGNIAKRVVAAGAAGGLTGEAVRELKGEEFNAAALGSNVALGAAFGVHGDNVRPEEARLPESAPETSTEMPQTGDLRPTEDVPATTLPPEANGPQIASQSVTEASKPRVRFNEETGQFEQQQPREFERQTEHPEDLTPDAHERNIGELFGDLVPEKATPVVDNSLMERIAKRDDAVEEAESEKIISDLRSASQQREYNEISDLHREAAESAEEFKAANRFEWDNLLGLKASARKAYDELNKLTNNLLNSEKQRDIDAAIGNLRRQLPQIRDEIDLALGKITQDEFNSRKFDREGEILKREGYPSPSPAAREAIRRGADRDAVAEANGPEIASQSVPEGSSVVELSPEDLSPAELAAFQRQPEPTEIDSSMLTPEELRAFGLADDVFQNNASGESSVSLEALNRFREEQEKGQHRMIINRDGSITPIVTADGVDYVPKEGQIIVQANTGDKLWTIIDHGDVPKGIAEGRVNAAKDALDRAAIERTTPDEEITLSSEARRRANSLGQRIAESKEPFAPNREARTTSTKNAVMEAERSAEGRDPIIREAAKSNPTTLDEAKQAIAENKNLPDEIIERLNSEGVSNISSRDDAVLLLEKARLRNEREESGKRATDPKLSDAERSVARQKWEEAEAKINALDQATYNSGKEWGRFGQFHQMMIRADYSLASLEQRARVRLNRPLKAEEVAELKPIAEKIEAAHNKVEETSAAAEAASREAVFQQFVKQMTYEMKGQKPLARHERLKKLEDWANESREALRKRRLGTTNASINPTDFFHLARIGAYHIAKGAVKFADWAAKMRGELGDSYDAYKDSLNDVYAAARATHETSAVKSASPEAVKQSIGEKVTQRDVYDLARAHVLNGVHGEKAVMEAVANDLKDRGLDERDVRRIFSDYGKVKFPSKEADKVELRELRQLVQMQESIDLIAEGKPPLKSGTQRDKPSQAVREKRRLLNDKLKEMEGKYGRDPEKLATMQQARLRNLENTIEDLRTYLNTGEKPVRKVGETPKPTEEMQRLMDERDALRKQVDEKFGDKEYQAKRAKSFKEQIARIEERIKNNDYARPEKRVPKPLDDANREAQYELHKAKELFYRKMLNKERLEKGQIAQFFLGAREARNYMRAVMTSIDLSAAGRQGWKLGSANPSIVPNAFFKQLTAMKSESHAYKIQQALEKDPVYNIAKKNGVEFTEDAVHSADKAEEKFMSRWLEVETEGKKGPMLKAIKAWNWLNTPVRASERAYRTYLNVLRLDSFKKLAAAAADSPNGVSDTTLKAIANYVNIATGRGKIGMTNKGAGALNEIFFAPRLRASQFNWLFGQPFYKGDATSRKLIREQYARHLGAIGATLTLGYMAHQVSDKPDEKFIEWDPRSTDFGKMRFGDTRIDLMAGLGQATTLLARAGTGTTKQANGKIAPLRDSLRFNVDASTLDDTGRMKHDAQGVGDVAGRYLANSLAPDMGYAWHALSGKDFKGDDFNLINESGNLITPMSFGNIKEVMKDHGIPAGTAITLLEMLGASVQHYDNTKRKPPKPIIPEEQRGIRK